MRRHLEPPALIFAAVIAGAALCSGCLQSLARSAPDTQASRQRYVEPAPRPAGYEDASAPAFDDELESEPHVCEKFAMCGLSCERGDADACLQASFAPGSSAAAIRALRVRACTLGSRRGCAFTGTLGQPIRDVRALGGGGCRPHRYTPVLPQ